VLSLLLSATTAWSAGTPAGTAIVSQSTVTYTVDNVPYTQQSNAISMTVAELLDVNVLWQNAAPVEVFPGAPAQALTFLLTNIGNGSDSFSLRGLSYLAGDDFDPHLVGIYLDTDGDGTFDPATDDRYLLGVNDPQLPADDSMRVFLVSDIPGTAAVDELGNCELTAESITGVGTPGTLIPAGGDGGIDAIVGATGGRDTELGTYQIAALPVQVVILKSATVENNSGGSEPVAGASVTYTLTVAATGVGTARGVVVTDAIPAHTTYTPNSLTLNGGVLTDGADADAGSVAQTTPGAVTVDVGDLVAGTPPQIIAFTVTID
jgi:uncharacterized repeat protein (TIGR01451 family)